MLEDFQTAAASMAHMRHLASTARGFYCFCLTARYGFKKFKRFNGFKSVLSVNSMVEYNPKDRNSPPVKGYHCGSSGAYFVLPTAAILFCGFLSVSRADQTGGEVQTGKLAWMDEHHHQAARA